jgi:hypothetical protein
MHNVLDVEHRLDRLESVEEIRQLAARYGVQVDARDIDNLIKLYSADTPVGRRSGRVALRRSFERTLGKRAPFRITVHFIGNHMIEIDQKNPDSATGVVYCRAEHQFDDTWVVATLQYWDTYVREDGRWLFFERAMKAFYVVDILSRPSSDQRVDIQLTDVGLLGRAEAPECWPSWGRFWSSTPEPTTR